MQFKQVPGHKEVKSHLIHEIIENRTPHAQLFLGKSGSGNLAMALAFVQYLLCTSKTPDDSCGQCAACVKTSKFIHPDLHFSFPSIRLKKEKPHLSDDYLPQWRKALTKNPYMNYFDWMEVLDSENKQGNISIDDCRSVISKLSLKPFESDKKILIMWLPEFLGNVGNALLKIIEEPSPGTYFILVAEDDDLILPTIVSRVQTIRIPALKDTDINGFLTGPLEIPENTASWISFMAEGDLNEAIRLAMGAQGDHVDRFRNWMQLCVQGDSVRLLDFSDQICKEGKESTKNFLRNSLKVIRESIAVRSIDQYQMRIHSDYENFLRKFSEFLNYDAADHLNTAVNKSISELERNSNPRITLFNLSLTLSVIFSEQKKAIQRS